MNPPEQLPPAPSLPDPEFRAANEPAPIDAPAIAATRRLLPLEADANMVLHARVFLTTHKMPGQHDVAAQQLWIRSLYRIMAAVGPALALSDEDMVHALAFHCQRAPHEIRGEVNVSRLRDACESAVSGLRVLGSENAPHCF